MFRISSKSSTNKGIVTETIEATSKLVESSTFNMPSELHSSDKNNKSDCWKLAERLFKKKLLEGKKAPDPKAVEEFLHFRGGLDNTIKICTSFKDQAEREYHKSDGTGKTNMVGKLLKTLTTVREIGDPFLSAAPESVAIAWWAISSVVQVAMKDMEKCELVAGASENMVTIILNCRLFEKRFANKVESTGDADTESRILQAIPQVLTGVLDFAWYTSQTFFTKNKVERFFTVSFSSTLKNLIDGITSDYQKLRVDTGDAFESRVMDQLETIYKQTGKSMDNMKELLFPKLDEIKNLIQEFVDAEKKKADAAEIAAQFKTRRESFGPNEHHKKQLDANAAPFQQRFKYRESSTWFFDGDTFQKWKQHDARDGPSLLCISAARGYGKSFMLTAALLRLQEMQKTDITRPIVLYFYFKKGDPATQLMVKGLESIVCQLLDDKIYITDTNVRKTVNDIVDKARTGETSAPEAKAEATSGTGPTPASTASSSNTHSEAKKKSGTDENDGSTANNSTSTLKSIIEQVGKELDRPIFLVLDAVDECEDRVMNDSDLMRLLKELTQSQLVNVRAIISTRDGGVDKDLEAEVEAAAAAMDGQEDEAEEEQTAQSTVVVRLDEESNSADMDKYLRQELTILMTRRMGKKEGAKEAAFEKELAWIIPSIKAKAKGSFTYASMVIASLEQPYRSTLKQMLQSLPEGMDELYRQSLSALTFDERSLISLALSRVVWSCGEVGAIEVAESFKRMYEFDEEKAGEQLVIEATPTDGEEKDEEEEEVYDPAEDPEILDVISHLRRAGRDFLKVEIGTNIISIDSSIRDWVTHEADLAGKWRTETRPMTDFFTVDQNGAWVLSLPIPAEVARGKGSRVDFRSERDAHLDITLEILQTLNHPKFQERYMPRIYVYDDDGNEIGGQEASAEDEEVQEEEAEGEEADGEAAEGEAAEGEDTEGEDTEGEAAEEEAAEGEAIESDEAQGDETQESNETNALEDERLAERILAGDVDDDETLENDSTAEAESTPALSGETTEPEAGTGVDEEAVSGSEDNTETQEQATDETEGHQDATDEAEDTDDEEVGEVEEVRVPRYEMVYWLDHLKILNDKWDIAERKGNQWKLLWERLETFFKPENFKKWVLQYDQYVWKSMGREGLGDGSEPLHFITQLGIMPLMEWLVDDLKADVNAMNVAEVTPIFYSFDPKVVKYLLEKGADINYVSSGHYTPLHHCLDERRTFLRNEEDEEKCAVVDKTYMEIAELYISAGADINLPDNDNWPPLFYAVEVKNEKLFRLVMDHEAQKVDILYADPSQKTVLHILFLEAALPEKTVEMLEELIKAGADVNAQDSQSIAPLCMATKVSNVPAMEVLLQHKADVNDLDEWGFMAIHLACWFTDEENRVDAVRTLLKHGAMLNSKNKEGWLPITYAVNTDHLELVELLLEEWKKMPETIEPLAITSDEATEVAVVNGDSTEEGEEVTATTVTVETKIEEAIKVTIKSPVGDIVPSTSETTANGSSEGANIEVSVPAPAQTEELLAAEIKDDPEMNNDVESQALSADVQSNPALESSSSGSNGVKDPLSEGLKDVIVSDVAEAPVVEVDAPEEIPGSVTEKEDHQEEVASEKETGESAGTDAAEENEDDEGNGENHEGEAEAAEEGAEEEEESGEAEEPQEDASEWLKVSQVPRSEMLTLQSSTRGFTLLYLSADRTDGGVEVAKRILAECTPEQVKFLLETTEYDDGYTPLHGAARFGNEAMVTFLLEQGASITPLSKDGKSAIALTSAKWIAALEEREERDEDEPADEVKEAKEDKLGKCLLLLLDSAEGITDDSMGLLHSATARGSAEVLKKVANHGSVPDVVDTHGWSAAHYGRVYNTISVLKDVFPDYDIVALGLVKTLPPSRFSTTKKAEQLEISEDGLQCWLPEENDGNPAAIIADHPIPAEASEYYYEMTILEGTNDYPLIGLGFLSEEAAWDRMPGWKGYPEYTSYGYHGDDGNVFEASNSGRAYDLKRPSADHKYKTGDTVGCGFDVVKQEIFYSHNGEYLGPAFVKVKNCRMFPAIGIHETAKVSINFGTEPFKFHGERAPHMIRRGSTGGERIKRVLSFSLTNESK